jgi:hypothetical protein
MRAAATDLRFTLRRASHGAEGSFKVPPICPQTFRKLPARLRGGSGGNGLVKPLQATSRRGPPPLRTV